MQYASTCLTFLKYQINIYMKCVIAVCSLKPNPTESKTKVLADYFVSLMEEQGVECEMYYMADLYDQYQPGVDIVDSDDDPDAMTKLMQSVLNADMFVIATPIWWGGHSSLAQTIIERFTYFDDWAIKNNVNPLYGKTFGVIITGGIDGYQHVMGNMYNFATNLGFTIVPDGYANFTGKEKSEILKDEKTLDTAKRLAKNLYLWSKLMVDSNIGVESQAETIERSGEIASDSLRDQDMVDNQ